jgi:hypothetical protein
MNDLEKFDFNLDARDEDMWSLLAFVQVYDIKSLPVEVSQQLTRFYCDKIRQVSKQTGRDVMDDHFLNTVHYCICRGYEFFRNLTPFKLRVCLATRSQVNAYWLERIASLMQFL